MGPAVMQPRSSEDFPQSLTGPGMDPELIEGVAEHGVDDLEDPHDRDDDSHHPGAAGDGVRAARCFGPTSADRSGRRRQVGSHVSSVAKKNREISVIFLTKDPSMWFYRSQHTKRMPQER